MKQLIGQAWFSNLQGNYGIVLYKDESGVFRAGLSLIQGNAPLDDIQRVMDYGCRFPIKAAIVVIEETGTIQNKILWESLVNPK